MVLGATEAPNPTVEASTFTSRWATVMQLGTAPLLASTCIMHSISACLNTPWDQMRMAEGRHARKRPQALLLFVVKVYNAVLAGLCQTPI